MKKIQLIILVWISSMYKMYASEYEIAFSGDEYKDSKELRAFDTIISSELEKHKQAYRAYSNLLAKKDKTCAEQHAILDAQRVLLCMQNMEFLHRW
jgi:hypothetical protein